LHLQSGGYFGSALYKRLQSSSYVKHLSFAWSNLARHVFVILCWQNSPLKSSVHSQWTRSLFKAGKQVPPFSHGLPLQPSSLHDPSLQSIFSMPFPMVSPSFLHFLFLVVLPGPHDSLHFDQAPHCVHLPCLHFSGWWRIVARFDGLLIARSMPIEMSLLFPANPPRSFDFCAACEYVRVCNRAKRPCCHIFLKSQFVV